MGGGAPYPAVPGTILLYATKKCAEKNIGIPKKCRKKIKAAHYCTAFTRKKGKK